MFSKLIVLAGCAALVCGEKVDVTVDETQDIWEAFGDNSAMASKLDSIGGRVDSMEALGDTVGSAITVAQSSTARLDDLVAEIAGLKAKLAVNVDSMKSTFKNSGQHAHIKMVRQHAQNTANALDTGAVKGIGSVMEASVNTAATIQKSLDSAKAMLSMSIDNLDTVVEDAIEEAKKKSVYQGSAEHIKEVTGIDYKNTKSYLVWTKTSNSYSSQVKGRKFYKIKFNLKTPGYFTSGSDEMFMACRALSMKLFEDDKVERDLVPPCNHWSRRQNVGGIGQCFMVERSYFSHCGGGGYWHWQHACGGIAESDLRGIVGYESTWENYDAHLCHRGGANSHTWCYPYRGQAAYQYTLCTSQNVNFKK